MSKHKEDKHDPPWDKELAVMRHKDLKRAVVMQGIPFKEVIEGDHYRMAKFFIENYYVERVQKRLDEFDEWLDDLFRKRGYDPKNPEHYHLFDPRLRLGFVGEKDEEGNITKIRRVKGIKKEKKPKRERNNEFGIFAGTAKELTFRMQSEGKPLDEVVPVVKEAFPDRAEKSIRIWYSRAKKANKLKNGN